jgi:transposase
MLLSWHRHEHLHCVRTQWGRYHVLSRCIRRAFLLGNESARRKDGVAALLRSKMSTRSRLAEREVKRATKTIRDWQDRVSACVADAQRAADRHPAQAGFTTLDITAIIEHHDGPAKRGWPRQRPEPALAAKEHWRVRYTAKPVAEDITKQRLHDQAAFILIRTTSKKWTVSDEKMIVRSHGQYQVEHGFAWLKSGAPIDPICLRAEHRNSSPAWG